MTKLEQLKESSKQLQAEISELRDKYEDIRKQIEQEEINEGQTLVQMNNIVPESYIVCFNKKSGCFVDNLITIYEVKSIETNSNSFRCIRSTYFLGGSGYSLMTAHSIETFSRIKDLSKYYDMYSTNDVVAVTMILNMLTSLKVTDDNYQDIQKVYFENCDTLTVS